MYITTHHLRIDKKINDNLMDCIIILIFQSTIYCKIEKIDFTVE